ncbi:3-ketoacyl-CoA thiolase with broad chain length specificity, partial [Scheffersomyces spartinae]
MERLNQLLGQLSASKADAIRQKNPDDVVIVGAYRTAIGKARKGSFKETGSDYLLSQLFKELLKKTGVDASLIEDVTVGNVLNPAAGATEHRAASLASGIPDTAAFVAINRQCSSGLMAIGDIANKIKCGEIDCGLAAGVESMSTNWVAGPLGKLSPALEKDEEAKKCLIPMGITSENVAQKYQISRAECDAFSAKSYAKAAEAVASGKFKDEILPIEVSITETKGGPSKRVVVDTDEGPRKGVTAESLGKLKPSFRADGITHAGNASQVSDGAAAVLLMRRSLAESKGYPIQGKFVLCSSVGVPPEIMGVGPAYAIPRVLQKCGITIDDVAVFEVNEAFATQCIYSQKQCNIPDAKLNPNGGAIAL